MMSSDTCAFAELRRDAAREFAQTMIVIDDEASQGDEEPSAKPAGRLRSPSRRTRSATSPDAVAEYAGPAGSDKHALDAKALIDNAMELGLICSVLRPKEKENFRDRVVHAANAADIVCLDWEFYNDGGEAASKIIADIIREDDKQNGRLRLIAVYTGDSTNNKILDRIFTAIPQRLKDKHEFKKEPLKIESKNGVRIVCLFKAHGVQLPAPRNANQVGEDRLPARLQSEFAKLSEGLLSNVALVTIASIRKATHHVLSKFTGQMDGPFFHHRALIENPDDAVEYAGEIILSELKGAVDKRQVADRYAMREAIAARIQEMVQGSPSLTLHYKDKDGHPDTCALAVDLSIKIVTDGWASISQADLPPKRPSEKIFKQDLSSLFSSSQEAARAAMHKFAALTGVCAHPGSHPYRSGQLFPRLGLGTIIRDKNKNYLMCLQARCDSVRIKDAENFLFVPLDTDDIKPEHVVPVPSNRHTYKLKYIGLRTSKKSYRVVRSIAFSASQGTRTVNAKKVPKRAGLHFQDTDGMSYRWVADLKHERALRTAQRLGQHMGRLGFDEFEPYRKGDG